MTGNAVRCLEVTCKEQCLTLLAPSGTKIVSKAFPSQIERMWWAQSRELTMSGYDFFCRELGFSLQGVNVLSEAAEQQTLLVQQGHEVMSRCWLVSARK